MLKRVSARAGKGGEVVSTLPRSQTVLSVSVPVISITSGNLSRLYDIGLLSFSNTVLSDIQSLTPVKFLGNLVGIVNGHKIRMMLKVLHLYEIIRQNID